MLPRTDNPAGALITALGQNRMGQRTQNKARHGTNTPKITNGHRLFSFTGIEIYTA
jgi:hypothetical protein